MVEEIIRTFKIAKHTERMIYILIFFCRGTKGEFFIFHMIFIMFLSISIVAFSPSNSSVLVPLGLLVALITVAFVWKYDRKKSTGRVLLDIVFCFAALIAWANAVGHIDLYTGIIGTWVFIILSIRF